MTAEFAGGLVSITTADMPSKNSLRISLQGAYNSKTTGKEFLTYQTNTKRFGLFSEVKQLLPDNAPTARQITQSSLTDPIRYETAKLWDNSINPKLVTSQMPAMNANINFQRRMKLADKDLGLVAFVNYSNSYQRELADSRVVQTVDSVRDDTGAVILNDAGQPSFYVPETDSGVGTFYTQKQNLNAIFNLSYNIGEKSKISWKNLFNYYSSSIVDTAYGRYVNPSNASEIYFYYFNPQRFIGQDMYSTQLLGEHSFTPKEGKAIGATLKWEANLSFVNSREPGYFSSNYDLDTDTSSETYTQFHYTTSHQGFVYALMGKENDQIIGGRVDLNIPVLFWEKPATFKTGLFTNLKSKELRSRIAAPWYAYTMDTNGYGIGYHNLPSETTNVTNLPNFFTPGNVGDSALSFIERTTNYNNYDATSNNYAVYGMLDLNITSKLRALVGVRYEHFIQKITLVNPVVTDSTELITYNTNNPATTYPEDCRDFANLSLVDSKRGDLLPYLTLIQSISDKTNLRLSMNQTLTRPKEQELVPLNILNQMWGIRNIGNPALTRTKITHFDLRFETFPTGTEIMSASLFYKYFDNPAEARIFKSIATDVQVNSYTNQTSAMVAGIEFEFRRRLSSLFNTEEGILRSFTLYTNLSLMQSRVNVASVSPSEILEKGRSLQGQAGYVVNAGIIFSEPKTNIGFALFYNRVGQRIAMVGEGAMVFPSFVELSRDVIDFQISKSFKNGLAIRFSIPDLLNQPIRWVQIRDHQTTYDETRDKLIRHSQKGFTMYLGLSYQF